MINETNATMQEPQAEGGEATQGGEPEEVESEDPESVSFED